MGRYITQSDIEDVFGQSNVARWSNLDNLTTGADTDRITTAISRAEDFVDNRFRKSVYTVPLSGTSASVPSQIVDITARIAGVWLHDSRGIEDFDDDEEDSISRHLRLAERQIDRILRNEIELDATRDTDEPDSISVI